MTDHLAAISADAREWVELRIDLAKTEVVEKKDELIGQAQRLGNAAAFFAVAGVVALYGLGFLFATLADGLAWAFAGAGSAVLKPLFWGLLITTLILLAIAGILALIGKSKLDAAKAIEASLKAPDISASDQATPLPKTRHQLQDLERDHARQMAS